MNWIRHYKYHLLEICIIIVIVGLIFIPIMYKQNFVETTSDYPVHSRIAQTTTQLNKIQTPHFLWHVIITLVRDIIFVNEKWSSLIAIVIIYCVLVFLLNYVFRSDIKRSILSYVLIIILSLSSVILTPILMPTFMNKHLYFGYINLATYHNPTIVLLKLLALLNFYYILKILSIPNERGKYIAVSAITIILATISKPNYTICILPALAIYMLCQVARRKHLQWKSLILGTFLPSISILLWQFYFTYQSTTETLGKSTILFAPLAIMKFYSDKLLLKFFLSIIFPLAVFVVYFPRARRDTALLLSWPLFGIGCVFTYLFAESGGRKTAANFFWSGQITLFILFVFSILFLLKENKNFMKHNILKNIFLGIIFSLHVISGMFFYYFEYYLFHKYW